LPVWTYGSKQLLYNLLSELKDIFLDTKYMQMNDSYNKEAALLFAQDIETFYENVIYTVNDSYEKLY